MTEKDLMQLYYMCVILLTYSFAFLSKLQPKPVHAMAEQKEDDTELKRRCAISPDLNVVVNGGT